MSSQSVLLIGASGFLGRYMTQEFLAQKSKFARVAILADPSKVDKFAEVSQQGMEIVVGSFLEPSSFNGFTTVICMVGDHAMIRQPAIIDAAISGGVTNFYPSEFGCDISQGPYLTNRYYRDKHLTREHLKKVAKDHPQFGYTFIITSGFAEFAASPQFGVDVEKGTFEFYGPKNKESPFTGVRDVAKYTAASVLMLDSSPSTTEQCRTFRIPTANHKWDDVIEIISRLQGKSYSRTYHATEEALALAEKYAREGDVENELAYSLKAVIGDADGEEVPKPWDHDKFPEIHPESLEVSLARYLGKQ
ncbi:hypothetical protein ACMFMG_009312 [Clarireedia jacksonii]